MSDALKRTPLYEEHVALGARMVPFAGFEMPVQYTGIIEEHKAVRSGVGIFDVCHMAEFRVFGFGAFDFLQRMLTNDLSKIGELGRAQYTLLLDDEGGIIDDLIVYHSGDLEYLIIANASNRDADFEWLKAHAPDDLELVDESDRTALIAVQGPEAVRVVSELAGDGWTPPARFTLAGNVSSPSEPVVRILAVDILERIPSAVHGSQVLIPHPLDILDRVFVETGLPKPVAEPVGRILLVELLVGTLTSWERFLAKIDGPWALRKWCRPRRLDKRHRQRISVLALALDLKLVLRRVTHVPQITDAHVSDFGHLEISVGKRT